MAFEPAAGLKKIHLPLQQVLIHKYYFLKKLENKEKKAAENVRCFGKGILEVISS